MQLTQTQYKKLNALVAKYVMRWTLCTKDKFPNASDGKTYYIKSHSIMRRWEDDHQSQDRFWEPSNESAAAMEVLKKCAEKLQPKRIHIYAPCETGGQWMVSNCEANVKNQINQMGDTLEVAICLFAVKLFGQGRKF